MMPEDWAEYVHQRRRRELLDRLWPFLVLAVVAVAMALMVAGWCP